MAAQGHGDGGQHAVTSGRLLALLPAAVAVVLAGLSALVLPLTSNAFWLVAVAPRVWHEHAVRFSTDHISALPIEGGSWVVQPWLPALVTWGSWEAAGHAGLGALAALAGGSLGLVAFRVARAWAPPLAALAVVLVAAPLAQPMVLRSELFALVLLGLLYLALYSPRVWWWAAPLVIVAWANVHGSVPYGIALCVAAVLGMVRAPAPAPLPLFEVSLARRLAWLSACCLAWLVNPLGSAFIAYARDVQQVSFLDRLTPLWRPLDLTSTHGVWLILVVLLVLASTWVGYSMRNWRAWLPLLPIAVVAIAALRTERQVVWLALLALPELARGAHQLWGWRAWPVVISSRLIGSAIVFAMLLGVAVLAPGGPLQRDLSRNGLPTSNQLGKMGQGDPVFASAEWADYVFVRTGARVFIDARLERYRQRDLALYLRVVERDDDAICEVSIDYTLLLRHDEDHPPHTATCLRLAPA